MYIQKIPDNDKTPTVNCRGFNILFCYKFNDNKSLEIKRKDSRNASADDWKDYEKIK